MRNWSLLAAGAFAVVFLVMLGLFLLFGDRSAGELAADGIFWETVAVFYGIAVIAFLFLYRVDADRVVMKENDLDDTDWMSLKEIEADASGKFKVTEYAKLADVKDGIVISAEKDKKDVRIVMTQELHSLIIGTSGTGKTTGFVDPNIAILSRTKSRPSMIITDPKKELYLKHNAALRARGYTVLVLDLRSPYTSIRWNPFRELQRRVVEIMEIDDALAALEYNPPEDVTDVARTRAEAEVRRQTLMDEMEDGARDIIQTLCPIKNKEQSSWESGARDLIQGFLLALCEDAIAGKIPVEKIILLNLYQNVTKYCTEDTTMLKNYLLNRDEFSKVKGLANTVLVTSERTLTSYLTDVNAYMQQLSDDGILSMTSDSEIDPFSLDEKPTAVFIVIPDEKKTRHGFVTLFIAQMYKELTEKCNVNLRTHRTRDITLRRRVYFILDEFGNIPAIHDFDNIISVARSRGFRFLLILQSLTQLETVYGASVAKTVKDNCAVKIFIGTDDGETKKEFSALCGMKKIKSVSVNTSTASDPSSSTSAHEVPLITEAQLQRLNGSTQGDAIISVRGFRPIWGRFTPSYDLKCVYFPDAMKDEGITVPRMFDKKAAYTDIEDILPMSEEEKRIREEYDKSSEHFMKKWEEIMREEYEFGSADGEGDELSAEDEKYLKELELEEAAEREPDDSDVCLDLEEELCCEFPELLRL